jgi:hypothetical protein
VRTTNENDRGRRHELTREGWRELVLAAVRRFNSGDDEMLDLLSTLLEEQDNAKQALRTLGYGCCGMPWADVVAEIEEERLNGA